MQGMLRVCSVAVLWCINTGWEVLGESTRWGTCATNSLDIFLVFLSLVKFFVVRNVVFATNTVILLYTINTVVVHGKSPVSIVWDVTERRPIPDSTQSYDA